MSETTPAIPSIGAIAAGLTTAVVEATPGLAKVEAAIEHGADTFIEHNEALTPVVSGAQATLGALAAEHGLGPVWAVISGLFPWLATIGHHKVNVPNT